DTDGAIERPAGAAEGEHEPVALGLDLETTVGLQLLPDDAVVGVQHLEPAPVAQALVGGGRPLDVGEEERDGPVRSGVRTEVGTRPGRAGKRGPAPRNRPAATSTAASARATLPATPRQSSFPAMISRQRPR